MYGVKEVGKYNVDYKGNASDGKTNYNMIGFQEFDNDTSVGKEKVLYFLCGKEYVIPELDTEEKIERFLEYNNFAKIGVRKVITYVIEEL